MYTPEEILVVFFFLLYHDVLLSKNHILWLKSLSSDPYFAK